MAKDLLDRNKLLATGTPEDAKPGHSLMVHTQAHTNIAAMTHAELEEYEFVGEVGGGHALAPKVIEGIVTRVRHCRKVIDDRQLKQKPRRVTATALGEDDFCIAVGNARPNCGHEQIRASR